MFPVLFSPRGSEQSPCLVQSRPGTQPLAWVPGPINPLVVSPPDPANIPAIFTQTASANPLPMEIPRLPSPKPVANAELFKALPQIGLISPRFQPVGHWESSGGALPIRGWCPQYPQPTQDHLGLPPPCYHQLLEGTALRSSAGGPKSVGSGDGDAVGVPKPGTAPLQGAPPPHLPAPRDAPSSSNSFALAGEGVGRLPTGTVRTGMGTGG